jgi:hypothetical protein
LLTAIPLIISSTPFFYIVAKWKVNTAGNKRKEKLSRGRLQNIVAISTFFFYYYLKLLKKNLMQCCYVAIFFKFFS